MFKLHKNKSDRLGERLEFKFSSLQALQVPKGWDRLCLSIISVESGKAITKSNKASVRSGTCQWTETMSESILIPQNDISKDFEECLFKIVVSMGSHRSGTLGEITINLTDYTTSRDSGTLALPLQKCCFGTILQVRIQCLNPKIRFSDGKVSKKATQLEGLHTNSNNMNSKSETAGNVFNRSVGFSSSNNAGANYQDESVHRDASFSASGSHPSSDSGDSSMGRLNFFPRDTVNGGSYVGRQDSSGSHDELCRSNPSSFNSRPSGSSTPNRWQESTMETSRGGLAPLSSRPSGSSKDFLEAAEETIDELQDEAKMWERHAQKLKIDLAKLKKESSDKSKRQAELDMDLSVACSERDSLKQEVEQLKLSLEEKMTKQNDNGTAKINDMLQVQKELEDELKFQKESNANLCLQLKKTQEANIEFVAVIKELEEAIKKQRLKIPNFLQVGPIAIEAEWAMKLSAKEVEIAKLEKKVAGKLSTQQPHEMVWNQSHHDLIEDTESLRAKVEELERDCAELTEENLELMYKMKLSEKATKVGRNFGDSDSQIGLLTLQICQLEEQLRMKEMLREGLTETSSVQMNNLEKKCADLEHELLYFKNQAYDLNVKLNKREAEVEERTFELDELPKKLESYIITDLKSFNAVCARRDGSHEDQENTIKLNVDNGSDFEEPKAAFLLKEKEVDVLHPTKEELENLNADIRKEKDQLEEKLASVLRKSSITSKCLEVAQQDLMLLTSSVDSHVSSNKILERKLLELEICKIELETEISELEKENIQSSERVSGLEAQLRDLTNDKESNRKELDDSISLLTNVKNEVEKQQAEMELERGELKHKLQEAQKRLSEAQEEIEYLKRSHSKLQSTAESLIDENSSLQKSNGDLRRQNLDLHDHIARLELGLNESHKMNSEFLTEVGSLESRMSSLQKDIAAKERSLTSELEGMFQEHEEQEEMISQANFMLNQIAIQKAVEVDNLKREMETMSLQVSATHDERERMTSDALREVSSLRSDKIKVESSLQDAHGKVKLYETELQTLKQETGKKVQGLVDLLNASKQSEKMLISNIEYMQREEAAAKSGEEKCKRTVSELELKLKAADYEKEQIMEETSTLKIQIQKMEHLRDEIMALKSYLEKANFEKGKIEELLRLVSGECEGLKTERFLLTQEISNIQKGLHDREDDKRSRIALEEKLVRLEADLTAKEASYAHETELKNKVNRIKRANSEYQMKTHCLKEENGELMRKVEVLENELMLKNKEKQNEKVLNKGDSRTRDLEAKIEILQAKICILKTDHAEALETNNIYKTQLEGLLSDKQSSHPEVRVTSHQASKVASLETELKDMKERYLNMSLQYAEVEAEREQLVMKLRSMSKGNKWFS